MTDGNLNYYIETAELTTLRLKDASQNNLYSFIQSELSSNVDITLPILTTNDTFIFAAAEQTLTNKTLTTPTIGSFINSTHDHSNAAGGGTISYTNLTDTPSLSQLHDQNTDTGTTATSFNIDSGGTGFKLKNSSGEVQLRNLADDAYADLRVKNLVVEGTTTTVNSETVAIADNILLLNSDVTGAPSENSGIEIERGTSTNASVTWDETADIWKAGLTGSEVEISLLGHGHTGITGTTSDSFTINSDTSDVGAIYFGQDNGGVNSDDSAGIRTNAGIMEFKNKAGSWGEFSAGDSGEVNTGSNVGTAGVGVFKQKNGLELEFKKINAGSSKISITDNTGDSEVDIDIVENQVNHDSLLNYAVAQHREINDAGTLTTELFSASKIISELGGKADSSHTHTKSNISDFTEGDYVHVTGAETVGGIKTLSDELKIEKHLDLNKLTTAPTNTASRGKLYYKGGASGTEDIAYTTEGNYIQEDATDGTDFGAGKVTLHLTPDPAVKLLIHSDTTNGSTTFIDSSGSGHTVTGTGDTEHSTTEKKFGASSVYFSTAGDTLSIPSSTDFGFGTGDFTIDFWCRQSISTLYLVRIGSGDAFSFVSYPSNITVFAPSGNHSFARTFVANTWYHLALTRSGTNLRMFYNGTQIGVTKTDTSNYPTNGAVFGHSYIGTVDLYMDEIRVVKGEAKWTSNFTPDTIPYENGTYPVYVAPAVDTETKLLIHSDTTNGSTTFTDSSNSPHTITPEANAQHSTTTQKFGTSSIYFDGVGDRLTIPDSDDWSFGSGDFTIDFWINSDDWSFSGGPAILGQGNWPNAWVFVFNYGTSGMAFMDGSTATYVNNGSGTWNTGEWYHIALVRSGNNFTLYRNGSVYATLTKSVTLGSYSEPLELGLVYNYPFKGYMDEIRISKGIARWTSEFTPPTAPYPLEVGTYYVTTGTGAQIDTSAWGGISGVTVTQTTPANTDIKYLVSFDGRITWKYYDSGWTASSLANLQTEGMSKTELEAITEAQWSESGGLGDTLDVAIDLKTTDDSATPELDNIEFEIAGSPSLYFLGEDGTEKAVISLVKVGIDGEDDYMNENYFEQDASNHIRIKLNTLLTGVDADKVDGKNVDDTETSSSYLWTADKITTQLSGKSDTGHTHTKTNVTDFTEGDYVHVTGAETITGDKNFSGELRGGSNRYMKSIDKAPTSTTKVDIAKITLGQYGGAYIEIVGGGDVDTEGVFGVKKTARLLRNDSTVTVVEDIVSVWGTGDPATDMDDHLYIEVSGTDIYVRVSSRSSNTANWHTSVKVEGYISAVTWY